MISELEFRVRNNLSNKYIRKELNSSKIFKSTNQVRLERNLKWVAFAKHCEEENPNIHYYFKPFRVGKWRTAAAAACGTQ